MLSVGFLISLFFVFFVFFVPSWREVRF